ncbi:Lytic transglycosylase, catalytic [Xenorhabdus poinarii G6]|uniref:Lytic transglycosylase, catalytic n=1 Tax=Xenorhabdus poinarii G6 TaxID=1354304 RepID=A0A068R0X4_9GAMM|nr:lytic transglycosylase domain-containing protein [Xenorhabdus poinarii]CDG20694.1 Lytic transglycosylase, catalytic [Xenorhabdus poinarii G6]
MSNNAETIRDFLISLGFEVDGAGEKKFSAIIAGVTGNVLKLGAAVESAAASVVGFTAIVANGLDKLYWQAQRTGGAAEQIKSLGYAVSQAGGSVEGLNSSLENVAKFLRNNPGGEGFLRNMGIQTRDANGQLRDTASLVALVGERLSALPHYRANQYASILGIDENTLMAMRRGIGGYAADYQMIIKALGYNPAMAAKQANAFMAEFARLRLVTGSAKDKIGGELARVLTPSVEKLTNLILKHWPTIEKIIMSVVKAIMTMSEILGQVVFRGAKGIQDLISWWRQLDEGSQNLIKVFGLVAAAWMALNSKFLFSPIGALTTLMAAMFLLYDDYMTWKEGGKSLIDWGKWEPEIKKVKAEIKELTKNFKGLAKEITDLLNIDLKNWSFSFELENLSKNLGDFSKMLSHLVSALNHLNDGEFALAWDELQQAWNGNEKNKKDALPAVSAAAERHREAFLDGYFYLNNKLNEFLGLAPYIPAKDKPATEKGKPLLDSMAGYFNMLEKKLGLDPGILHGVAMTESSGNPNAIGPTTKYGTAKGMFQFIDSTAKSYGLMGNDVFDPHKSTDAAAKMLSSLLKTHNGNLDKALASYNWGIGNVQKYGMGNLPTETRNYIHRVKNNMGTSAKNSNFNFDPRMFDNATANINNMLSHTGYTPKRLELLANVPNQTTIAPNYNINVNGVDSPREAAVLTGEAVQRANAILVRSLQTKVS